ncbi:Gfo/Idh/MocA family oxidoreductase [Vibrio hannami]|uniref:Gfo/Idh/MocA family protein n=1 Tax=Vibrio hannami TaxID=2717094 RepID=UPI0024102828|nr:Gfo/Idh/MocA family oxidoreductase [Vibrio hannami]MDG3085195.1 Gfo/Idh/MocA family oxidoreductase [Vibrio hannami]
MKIAVIGLGDIACKAYLPVITQLSNVELIFCTRNQHSLTQLAQQYRIFSTETDYKSLIKHQPDAVMIHATTSAHNEIASFFLQNRIATFVDKPLVDSYEQAENLYEMAERYSTPLYVGFNRRHIPLYNQNLPELAEGNVGELTSLRWEKHRYNLTGESRTFIFDDFIHPLDSINLSSNISLDDIHIVTQKKDNQIARIDVQWMINGCIVEASMNRMSGATFERVSACYENQTYEFDSFIQGKHLSQNVATEIKLKDWTPMLESKGFVHMLRDWISVIEKGAMNPEVVNRNLLTHRIAEHIYSHVS